MDGEQVIIISYSIRDVARAVDACLEEGQGLTWEKLKDEQKTFIWDIFKNEVEQGAGNIDMKPIVLFALKQMRLKIIRELEDLNDESEGGD